jgi:hypothetical protein
MIGKDCELKKKFENYIGAIWNFIHRHHEQVRLELLTG